MRILAIHALPDTLWDGAWAFGLTLLDHDGTQLLSLGGCVQSQAVMDDHTRKTSSHIANVPIYEEKGQLRDLFWRIFDTEVDPAVTYVVMYHGFPAVTGFLQKVIEDNPVQRDGKLPTLHELATLLHATGIRHDIDLFEFSGLTDLSHINPVDMTMAIAACARTALMMQSTSRHEEPDTKEVR